MNAPAPIGHNQPATPYDALKAHIDDLDLEARNHLDGEPIKDEAQAAAVSRILDDARKASKAADEARKDEKRPHDEAAAAVQARWKPLLERADLAATTAKEALAPWLQRLEDEQRAAAEAMRKEAEEAAEVAAQTSASVDPGDLAGQTTARIRQESAHALAQRATRAEKARPHVRGGERANFLKSRCTAILSDPVAFARWAWTNRRPDYDEFLQGLANREVRHGPRDIPGITVNTERTAQ